MWSGSAHGLYGTAELLVRCNPADTSCTSLICESVCAVEAEVQEVARNAVSSLRGVRLCAEGHEEGRLTHLVLGQQRRTLKVGCPHQPSRSLYLPVQCLLLN